MTQDELINRIQILIEKPHCSIWPLNGDYYGDESPIERCGFRVCWSFLNKVSCPSEGELINVTTEQLNTFIQKREDEKLYNQYKDNLSMKALYNFQKKSSPDLTFLAFLKAMNNVEI